MAETLQGQRPKLMQVGPYAYDEYYVKFDIEFSDHGDTVSYNTQKYYIFNQEETGPGLAEDDQITLPYAVVIGFEFFLQQVPVSASDLLQAAIGVCYCTSVASIVVLLPFTFSFHMSFALAKIGAAWYKQVCLQQYIYYSTSYTTSADAIGRSRGRHGDHDGHFVCGHSEHHHAAQGETGPAYPGGRYQPELTSLLRGE